MSNLAYLRGDGLEIALAEERLPDMKFVAKSLGLRRLVPVHSDPNASRDAEPVIVLQCLLCKGTGLPHEMLANLDGKPYNSYEHVKCPEVKS
jgi:hypothetical protein